MPYISIKSRASDKILFEGEFENTKTALEIAVETRKPLYEADLRSLNLAGSTLDEALLTGADFSGSNLSGANLSEASIKDAIFINTTLTDVCFNQSDLSGSDFRGARFGATDIVETNLDNTLFSNTSCFSLNFAEAASMQGACYLHSDDETYLMSMPPKVMMGVFNKPLAMLDQYILVGHQAFPLKTLDTRMLLNLR